MHIKVEYREGIHIKVEYREGIHIKVEYREGIHIKVIYACRLLSYNVVKLLIYIQFTV